MEYLGTPYAMQMICLSVAMQTSIANDSALLMSGEDSKDITNRLFLNKKDNKKNLSYCNKQY